MLNLAKYMFKNISLYEAVRLCKGYILQNVFYNEDRIYNLFA